MRLYALAAPLVMAFVGDIMLGRLTSQTIQEKGPAFVWGDTKEYLSSADLVLGNLETTFTTATKAVPKTFNFKSAPANVKALTDAGIDIVSLANNHIKDFGDAGLRETIKTLNSAGILHVGAGQNEREARAPLIVRKKGLTIGILGYTDNEPGWIATVRNPGTNYIRVGDAKRVRKDIQDLKKKVDLVIVTLHWGPNMRPEPSQEFVDFAHLMIDAGASIIHGHSAHILQRIEWYKGGLILYDTGDFIDDYAVDPDLRNDQSAIFLVSLDHKGVKEVTPVPVVIKDMQVRWAHGGERDQILKRLNLTR